MTRHLVEHALVLRWCALLYRVPILCCRVCLLPSSGRFNSYLCRLKAILYTMIRAFEFELAVGADEIVRSRALPMSPRLAERPYLRSDPKRRAQLPLFITSVRRNE